MSIKGHNKTVNTKDQSNATVYWIWYLVCRHCRYKDQSKQCINAMFVNTVNTGVWGSYTTPYAEDYEVWKLSIKWPVAPARREGYCIVWAYHLGGLAVHQSVWGGSYVNFLGLVKLQGWLQARCTANPQFLKLKGTLQPSNSYKSMTKLHPPYPNWTCHKQII